VCGTGLGISDRLLFNVMVVRLGVHNLDIKLPSHVETLMELDLYRLSRGGSNRLAEQLKRSRK